MVKLTIFRATGARCVRNSRSDLFQGNFSMALYSFGGVNDQCSVTSWAVQETGMLPLLSCDSGMTARLKHKEKGPLVSREEEDSSTTVQFFF